MKTPHRYFLVPLLLSLFVSAACATEGGDTDTDAGSDGATAAAGGCEKENLPLFQEGQLTIATDKPAYEPWFTDNDPTNGKGFESAVAYAVAAELGFSSDEVAWTVVPFNSSYAPGEKDFRLRRQPGGRWR